jgi:hypothetical protein
MGEDGLLTDAAHKRFTVNGRAERSLCPLLAGFSRVVRRCKLPFFTNPFWGVFSRSFQLRCRCAGTGWLVSNCACPGRNLHAISACRCLHTFEQDFAVARLTAPADKLTERTMVETRRIVEWFTAPGSHSVRLCGRVVLLSRTTTPSQSRTQTWVSSIEISRPAK